MLPVELIRKIKKVHFKSGRLVNTMMAGQYKSVFRGSGIEFEEVREYTAGDEVKDIDWKVTSRMGRPYVKRYHEERELIVMLLMDISASGYFGTRDNLKTETAAEIASILAFNAIKNNDKVGAILFTDIIEKYIPPKKGSAHVWRVIKEFFSCKPQNKGTDIENAVNYLGKVGRKKTVSFLISDFISKDFFRELKIASKKHEIIGILLSDPGDFHLPGGGIVAMKDLETGGNILTDASSKTTRKQFEMSARHSYQKRLDILKGLDIDCIEINTCASVPEALSKYFRYREKKFR